MLFRSFQAKLLALFIAILVLLQIATLVAVHVSGQRTLQRRLADELQVGSRVLDRILSARGRQLSDTVRVLAADFAFREAIASGDRATITSVLSNHGSRIAANVVFLIGLDRNVVADTRGGSAVNMPFPLPALVAEAERSGESSAIVSLNGRPFQLVVVPVLAPQPIAWVCMGFTIDEPVLQDVKRLTALELSLWTAAERGSPLLLSTLSKEQRERLIGQRAVMSGAEHEEVLELGDEEFETLAKPLTTADRSRITALLQRSVADANRPFRQLELRIFVLSTVALFVAIVAAIAFARGVSRPLHSLAIRAEQIARGDYATRMQVTQRDEIGTLASAFNGMSRAIGDREEQIRHQSRHDALTSLPNRTRFVECLEESIHRGTATRSLGMIMLDVDRFREVNDTLGHQIGDELLVEFARRLVASLPNGTVVARLGGDEFAVLCEKHDANGIENLVRDITAALDQPLTLGDVSLSVSATAGVALFPQHASDALTLMKRADIALYDAKKSHVDFAFYEPRRDEHSLRRLAILSQLRDAITRDELSVFFQPKIDLTTGRAVHAEALVRWNHPSYGRIAPDEFIPLAEQSGQIGVITRWMLRKTIALCQEWEQRGMELCVAVNLSAIDLYDPTLPDYVTSLLRDAELPPSRLLLEITESAIMRDAAFAVGILKELKSRGIVLAIDDFGTGYSSLAHLKRLPVDELKIDKSFVLNLSQSRDDAVIVRSTIELGHNMGLKVIAEGVENEAAWDKLRELGCDMAQGYFVSRPLPADEFELWMRESRWGRGEH